MRSPSRLIASFGVLPIAIACCLPAQQTTFSAPMAERYGKPYVMVMINGKGPFRFIIDTGTGTDAFVSPELADELQLPQTGESAVIKDPSMQGGQRVPIVLLASVEIAGVEFKGVMARRHSVTDEAGTCQGLLGFTLFHDYLLTLDYPNRQVLLTKGALTPDGENTTLPFRMPYGVPIAKLSVNGQSFDAQLDSAGGGLTLPESLAEHQKWDIAPVVFEIGQTLTTRFDIKAAKLRGNVKVGKYIFTHPVVEIHAAFPLVNFGSPPMSSFAITFDQKNLLVRFMAKGNHFVLLAPPCPTHLTNSPDLAPMPTGLVPLG